MFIDRGPAERGTPLGVRCLWPNYVGIVKDLDQPLHEHGTPKGVRKFRILENYKHRTPPE